MVKTSKKVPPQLAPIDYIKIIDDYNTEAIKLSVEQLFPLFGLRVLKESDIRPIDLKENVLKLKESFSPTDDENSDSSILLYCNEFKFLFDYLVKPVKNSRSQKYKERALELLEQVVEGSKMLQTLEDILLIFVALVKPIKGHIEAIDSNCLKEPDFTIDSEDINIVEEVWATVYSREGTSLFGIKKKRNNSDASARVTLWYINSVLLFCRILQERGVFALEEA